jgi:predicted N-formylglutamate amidohydrolase
MIDRSLIAGTVPAIISIHSFTPAWRGRPRPWQVGILWDRDPRLAVPMLAMLSADPALTVGDNEPYAGALANDALYRHGTRRGLAHVLIEIRQDLIAGEAGAIEWIERLAPILDALNHADDVHQVKYHGSKTGPVCPI